MNYRLSLITLCIMLSGCQLSQSHTPGQDIATNQPDSADAAGIDPVTGERIQTPSAAETIQAEPEEPAEPVYDDLWQKLAAEFTWEVPDNSRVAAQRNFYLRHPNYLSTISKRAEPFLYMIMDELEQAGLPPEMALLPIVESSFDVFAYSHGAAAGTWQFISSTGAKFGLEQNWWYDGRRDVLASTEAAIKFLKYLNRRFDGDWLHALAAYNSGEGRVKRAIRNNKQQGKPTDFWSLALPAETRSYVPKMIALIDILQNPEKYGATIPAIANEPVLRPVVLDQQIDLAMAAKFADISLKDLQKLNPGHNRWATAPDMTQRLLLPLDAADRFEKELASTPDDQLVQWVRYQIRNGDSLGTIARKHGTTIEVIKRANQLTTDVINVGRHLMIPKATISLDDYPLTASARQAALQNSNQAQIRYTVKPGDSLWKIGKTYGASTRDIARWNGFAPKDPIRPGQTLVIRLSGNSTQKASGVTREVNYRVRNGDSLWRIGNRFQVKIADIKLWNQLGDNVTLQPGQSLKLFVDVTRI